MAEVRSGGERVAWVDAARGLAISLVVLYHATTWLSSVGMPLEGWVRVDDALVTLRMPLFFTVAGLFAGKWTEASWERLWRGKVALFAWVLVVWSLVGAAFFLLGVAAQGNCCSARGLSLVVLELAATPFAPRLELWFVWALAVFFLLARVLRRVDSRVLLAVAGLVCLLTAGQLHLPNIGWTKAPQYWFFFVLGSRRKDAVLAVGRAHPLVLAAAVVAWVSATVIGAITGASALPGAAAVLAVGGVVAGIGVSRALAHVPVVGWLGARTLPVYLAHTPAIIVVTALVTFTGTDRWLAPAAGWVVPAVALVAVVVALQVPRLPRTGVLYEPPASVVEASVRTWRRALRRPPGPASEPSQDPARRGG